MREALALVRVSWLTALSYRVNLLLSLLGLGALVLPLYFVTGALQGTMAPVIHGQGSQYFAFALFGMVAYTLVTPALTALPSAVSAGIGSGTLEALFATQARPWAILLGLTGYSYAWTTLRAIILLGCGVALGARISWGGTPLALLAVALLVAAYFGVSLVDAALYLAFRVRAPIVQGVLLLSALLGGVYYPTTVIPGWLRDLAGIVPLTYGLRALRRLMLNGDGAADVASDVAVLGLLATVSVASGILCFSAALHQARRRGSLAQY